MTRNARLRRLLEFSVAGMLVLSLAAALGLKPAVLAVPVVDQAVVLNIRAMIYHCPACVLVRNCGSDCVTVDISEARRRGARPCLTCGGICLARR
ncbi:MAG: hypothetical protein PHS14_15555 [Elusimicrobia bacterium]|nr:hypothetical protein [Elusimicrobiota bacterium]